MRGSSAADVDFDPVRGSPAAIASSVPSLRAVRWAMPANSFVSSLARAVSVSKALSLRSKAAWIARSRFSASLSNACWRSAASRSMRSVDRPGLPLPSLGPLVECLLALCRFPVNAR